MSIMGNGSRICERVEATATTIMRTCMWVSGKQTSAMASGSCSTGSRTGIRGSGRMTWRMERALWLLRMVQRTLASGTKTRSTVRERWQGRTSEYFANCGSMVCSSHENWKNHRRRRRLLVNSFKTQVWAIWAEWWRQRILCALDRWLSLALVLIWVEALQVVVTLSLPLQPTTKRL